MDLGMEDGNPLSGVFVNKWWELVWHANLGQPVNYHLMTLTVSPAVFHTADGGSPEEECLTDPI